MSSRPVTDEVAASLLAHGKLVPLPSYTYLFRADDGAIVMIDAGYTHWITGGTAQQPVIEEQTELYAKLLAAVRALEPSASVGSIEAVYFEHGHIDHIMQAIWVQQAKQAPLDVWAGSGDAELISDTDRGGPCIGGYPDAVRAHAPLLLPPSYRVHFVDTQDAARDASDYVDGGHGIALIAAPSHTPGSLMVHLASLNVVVTGNHLRPEDAGTQGRCTGGDNSNCKVDCDLYADSLEAFPPGARVLHVHPE